ncbi:MAG TPA: TlpA disulfide reductase family protein [Tepidisphaeraceae bacterium]
MKQISNVFCITVAFLSILAGLAAGAGRPPKEIMAELQQVSGEISRWGRSDRLMDPKYRHFFSEKLSPTLKRKADLLHELEAAMPSRKAENQYEEDRTLAMLSVLGDESAGKTLADAAAGADATAAHNAKLGLALRDWWADQTPDPQQTVLDGLKPMVKAKPIDDLLALTLVTMADSRASSPELADEARTIVEKELKGPWAIRYRSTPNRIGRPLVVSGTTAQGKSASTLAWKGKVVMIDFWATWCPPCRAEMPKVIELYKKYHDQGFEIMGVSNDSDRRELLQFVRDNPDIKWPQLFGPASTAPHWHQLSARFDVNAIPTVYLIDRNGTLRSMTARGELETLVPELLAEKPSETSGSGKTAG